MASPMATQESKAKSNGQFRDQLKDHVDGSLRPAIEAPSDTSMESRFEALRESATEASDKMREYGRQSESYLKAHPYQALAIGAAFGVVAGALLGRSRR